MAFDINTIIILIALWELLWKGLALYNAARKDQKYWFVALLFLNTVGVLPILYLMFFKKKETNINLKNINITNVINTKAKLSQITGKIPEMKVKGKKAKKPAKKKKK